MDPAQAWEPWVPDARHPWDLKWAGHLFRRGGFGAPLSELQEAVRQGMPATMTRLLGGYPQADEREKLLVSLGDRIARQGEPRLLRSWWIYAILYTLHPLREKITLFWHNHFATSIAKVREPVLMYNQHKLLRQHALGKFRPFLLEISRDPAMLVWLDSNNNVKGSANENYARELMELFSLGVGHYTEKDIREAARAFTGWHTNGDRFDFDANAHDDGPKTVLGQSGAWNGNDIVRIVLEQPVAAHFLVRKLYRFFISETADPPARLLEPLAAAFRDSDYDIAVLVKTLLSSRHFFSTYAYRQRIKSPVEFIADMMRTLGPKTVPPIGLVPPLDEMGQSLFAPPNVKGWDGGRSWLSTATVLARNNFAEQAVHRFFSVDEAYWRTNRSPEQQVDELINMFLDGEINKAARTSLVAFVSGAKTDNAALAERIREAAHAIMTSPEYQLA
jgi:uncharacterized protein (DUF1800 family)